MLLLIIPVVYLGIIAFRARLVIFSVAFIALIEMLFFLGFGYYFENDVLRSVSGVLALIAATPIFYLPTRRRPKKDSGLRRPLPEILGGVTYLSAPQPRRSG